MSFDKLDVASRFVNIMRQSARGEAMKLSPPALIGRMVNVDPNAKNGKCWITGDAGPVTVNLSQNVIPGKWDDKDQSPSFESSARVGAGSIVVLESFNGSLYVTEVLTGGQMAVDLQIINDTLVMQGAAGEAYPGGGTDQSNNAVDSLGQFTFRTAGFASYTGVEADQALMFGPYVPYEGGGTYFDMGQWRMTVFTTDYDLHYATKVFEFSISPYMMFSDNDFFATDNHFDRWFRLLPKSSITNDYSDTGSKNGDFDIDIAMRRTSFGVSQEGFQSWELWLRAIPRAGDLSTTYREWWTSIETDVLHRSRSLGVDGRFQQVRDTAPVAPVGYVGFHNANHIFHDSHDTTTKTSYFNNVLWDTGPWRSSELRTATDLQKTWTHSGLFSFDGTNIKWTGNILLDGIGRMRNGLTAGKATISCPSSGTIPVMGRDSTTVTCTGSGIPLAVGQSLWCGIPPGQGNADIKGFLFLVEGDTAEYHLPEWAVLIAARGSSGAIPDIQLGNGDKLDAWRAPTLQNSWVNWGLEHAPAGYMMNDSNLVVLRGLIKSGTAGTVFTLPAGFRPAHTHIFMCIGNGGTDTIVRTDVQGDGQVVRIAPAINGWLSLANIRFIAEQ